MRLARLSWWLGAPNPLFTGTAVVVARRPQPPLHDDARVAMYRVWIAREEGLTPFS